MSTVKVDCTLKRKSDIGKGRGWQSLAVCLASICRLIGASRRHVTPRWRDATLRRDHYECIIYCGLRMCCNSHHRNCIVLAAFKSCSAESGDVYVWYSWNLVELFMLYFYRSYFYFMSYYVINLLPQRSLIHYYTLIAACFRTRAIWWKRLKILPFSKINLFSTKLRMLTVVLSIMCSKISKN